MSTVSCLLLLGSLMLVTVPPLTDAQRQQLATAADRSPVFDEGALYVLLANAATWSQHAAATAAPQTERLDVAPLLTAPADYRGDVFLIEGRLAATPRPFGTLSRPGPWDQKLRQWPILIDGTAEDGHGQTVVLVYLLDSPAPADLPPVGARIRTIARFYKLWTSSDLEGRQRDYLTFVGRNAQWEAGTGPSAWGITMPMLMAVGLLLVAYIVLRSWLRRRNARHAMIPQTATGSDVAEYDSTATTLPRDPADALARLAGEPQTSERETSREIESGSDARS